MNDNNKTVIGAILFGGTIGGSLNRDARLLQELAHRDYEIHVFWAKERMDCPELTHSNIRHHWLYHGGRYSSPLGDIKLLREINEGLGKVFSSVISNPMRNRLLKRYPDFTERLIYAWIKLTCEGVGQDRAVVKRFAAKINKYKITHVLPILSLYCPWVLAAEKYVHHPVHYLVTFQGYEVCADYANHLGLENSLYRCLSHVVEKSSYPAIAVSDDYKNRIHEEIGIQLSRVAVIPPGIPKVVMPDKEKSKQYINKVYKRKNSDYPLLVYFGRCDAEKGIDLLLYAAAILKKKNINFDLLISGSTMYGGTYLKACKEIADRLRLSVIWSEPISDETRTHLYAASNCVICPSIQREPFGMVPVEAMAIGTPVIVPDVGGISGVIESESLRGGLRFKAWDTKSLADAIEELLTNKSLTEQLSFDAVKIASTYSVELLADRVLEHMSLPLKINA